VPILKAERGQRCLARATNWDYGNVIRITRFPLVCMLCGFRAGPECRIPSQQSRNQKAPPTSVVRAILDDPPLHIRSIGSRARGGKGWEPCGFRPLPRADHPTEASRPQPNSVQKVSRVSR
jgi:hypothetical protein